MRKFFLLLGYAFGFVSLLRAEVFHVPVDYPSIQAALDVLESGGDTVLVDVGEYAEALVAPSIPFVLLGNTVPDSGDFPRPVIDASLLPEDLRNPCLTISSGSVVKVENIKFRNQNPMSPFTEQGGIFFSSYADSAIFRWCAFDSLYGGIFQPDSIAWWPDSLQGILVIDVCVFREDSAFGVHMSNGSLLATNCVIDGGWGLAGIECGPNSIIQGCTFRNRTHYLLSTVGQNIRIIDCVFGPSGTHFFNVVKLNHFSGTIVNCIFTDLIIGPATLFAEAEGTGAAEIMGNTFFNNNAGGPQARVGTLVIGQCNPNTPVIFDDNTVIECSTGFSPKALEARTCVTMTNNRIIENEPQHRWAIQVDDSGSLVANRNIISGNGAGMRNLGTNIVDARDNWWGDSTGPRATTNPGGLGDSVGDNIIYEPWTIDTLDWIDAVEEEMPVIPEVFELNAYPNPFNSSATLLLRVPDPSVLRVELFDMLGRRVKEVFSGTVAIEKKISFDAAELPSGIYFARATDVYFQRPLVTEKLLLIR